MNFASDNCSGAHPAILSAIMQANAGHMRSYGGDEVTARAVARVRDVLEAPQAEVFFVATGTAANALACAAFCPPYGRIFCHPEAHIETSECGAPELFSGGAKLALVPAENAKLAPDALAGAIRFWRGEGLGGSQPALVSVANATELGTLYDPDQTRALADTAHAAGLAFHVDGARFANAVAALGCAPADLATRAGVDVLSFGGTKNGCLGVEAVVVFAPARAVSMPWLRKRAGHLLSKHRYLSAQFDGMLADGLWLELGAQANLMAARLAQGLAALPGVELIAPVQSNAVFARVPTAMHVRAQAAGAVYHLWSGPDEPQPTIRLVAGWDTTEEKVDALLAALAG